MADGIGMTLGQRGGFDVVTLDSPGRRNALSLAVLDGLNETFENSADDPSSRGIVIDHTGPVFSAGVDLKERRQLEAGARSHSHALADLYRAMWAYPKPVLCRIDGAARGGGLGLVVLADVVVATRAATFAFSEVRVGVAPALVGALAMARFGSVRLASWLLSGETFDAERARHIGIVIDVVDDDAHSTIEQWCAALRRGAPNAQGFTKELTKRFVKGDVAALVEEMERASAGLFEADEAVEGMAAFAEKRPPSWARPAGE